MVTIFSEFFFVILFLFATIYQNCLNLTISCFFHRKVVTGAAYESGEFTVTMSLYYDESRATPLSPNAEIQVLDFIYVTIQLDVDLFDSQFYVQVRDGLKAMALYSHENSNSA